uniref:Uncharacterized protein n=1 Tax=Schistocephalus solidus TaxID=70667 RepID=A0A0X3PQS1_SCHSO
MDPGENKRSHRHHLQNILPRRLVGALRRLRNARGTLGNATGGGSSSSYRSGTLTYNAYSSDACSTLSMPASYSAGYYTDEFSPMTGGDEDHDHVSALDRQPHSSSRRGRPRRNMDSLEYPEYANMETFKQCLGNRRRSATGSDITPTNGRTPHISPKPTFLFGPGGIINEDSVKITRLRSMRDTERRMRTVTQVPSYILTASELEVLLKILTHELALFF